MQSHFSQQLNSITFPKHFPSHFSRFNKHNLRTKLSSKRRSFVTIKHNRLTVSACKASSSNSVVSSSTNSEEDAKSTQLFEVSYFCFLKILNYVVLLIHYCSFNTLLTYVSLKCCWTRVQKSKSSC